jgi:hypothetical protein
VALPEHSAHEESKTSAPCISSLRRVASARVDELPRSNLHRSRTIPTSTPPVPSKPRFHTSSRSSVGHSANLGSIGSSADAIAAAMSGMVRDGGFSDRVSRLEGQCPRVWSEASLLNKFTEQATPDTAPIKWVLKLDKSRYPKFI